MERKITGPVVLVVLDGWGLDEVKEHNGVAQANTPNFDRLSSQYPYTTLQASGEHVGLPAGQIGNSEVGHTTIGAGTVIYQDLVRIGKDVEAKKLDENAAFQQAFNHAIDNNSQLHIMGLLSIGGVHSHEDHFIELFEAAVRAGVKKIVLHPFMDGRDSDRMGGATSLAKLEAKVAELGCGQIATVTGRYFAMDRDKNWDRTQKAFDAISLGQADLVYNNGEKPSEVVKEGYVTEKFDELLEPMVFVGDGEAAKLNENDSIIFTNFRTDRTRQLSKLICDQVMTKHLCFVTMTDYGNEVESIIAYEPMSIEETIASVVAKAGLSQAHFAETEKFAHATYFLNGGREELHELEEHVLVPSNKDVKTHDEKPEMKAREITDEVLTRLDTNDFIFINYANPDMVGHTANEPAIVVAVETVDKELGRLVEAVLERDGAVVAIADHGNAETIVDRVLGTPHTAHTTNPVPCILISNNLDKVELKQGGGLKDIAPTVLDLLGLEKPSAMTGESLIKQP